MEIAVYSFLILSTLMISLKSKIAQSVFQGFVGGIVVKASSAIGYVLILSRLSIHDYGVFVLLVSLVGPASSIILFSFDRIFVSHFAAALGRRDFSAMKGLFVEYYRASLVMATLFFIGVYLLRNYFTQFDVYLIRYFWAVCLFVATQISMNMVFLFLEGSQRFKEIWIVQSVESISRTGAVIIACLSISFSVDLVILLYAGAKLIATIVGVLYVRRLHRTYFPAELDRQKGILLSTLKQYGKWDIARNLFEQAVQPLKFLIIKFFVNIESVAIYDFAKNVYSVTSSLFPVKSIIFPAVARSVHKKEVLYRIVEKSKKYMGVLYIVSFVAILVITPTVVRMIFPQYQGFEYIVYLTVLRLFVDVYKIGQDALLYAFNRQAFMFKVQPFFTAISIILDIVFAKAFGLVGIVISWHLYALITGFVQNRYLFNVVGVAKIKWKDLLRFDNYDKEILLSIVGRIRSFFSYGSK